MMRQGGWKLHGDKEAIWIEKDGVEIRFDIIIPTPRGALYCMYYKRQPEVAMRAEEIAMSAMD
jgi:predicted nucleotidyltransferase